ncbi:hypothetical protein D0S48_18230 [Psychrobacillus sp. AK 1817]|uniref:hypothetical protein n=1 Tax=Psychrobacillus sp. AK 1817 TaxID=2303505 RepID=UPI001246DF87|nr:hypothetical protein [Psychrobacillus sp. AK 1817]QEY22438.1 hypothetical protein D0S48_18230 [Psychrobacillus sp. AK 1817]
MKIPFEDWLIKQNISVQASELFKEAILCYKASAYRASLLFSYLTFQTVLKDRVLEAKKPSAIPQGLWDSIQRDLLNDDIWESKLFETVNRKQPAEIFLLSEEVRKQYEYWKDRRNDCAHAKGNQISYQHVEVFWLFIESNLAKFVVNGGKESLIEEIKVHYDWGVTPRSADYTKIIESIPLVVEKLEHNDFLQNIYNYFNDKDILTDDTVLKFWVSLLKIDGEFSNSTVKFLVDKGSFILELLMTEPILVVYFRDEKRFIRSLWKEKFWNSYRVYPLFITMLRNKIIPQEEIKEAIERISVVVGDTHFSRVEQVDVTSLQESGFFEIFKDLAFGEFGMINNFNWARKNKHIICLLLKLNGVNSQIVSVLNDTFNAQHTPWRLGDAIRELFEDRPSIKESYIKLNEEIGGKLPESLGFN